MTQRIPLIGIGSPFADDTLGIRLVEALKIDGFSAGFGEVAFEFLTFDRPGWGLLEVFQGVDTAIVVDAMVSGEKQGSVVRLDPSSLPEPVSSVTSHDVGLLAVLRLGAILGLLPEGLLLYGIEITPLPAILDPTPPAPGPVQKTADALRQAIIRDLGVWIASRSMTRENRLPSSSG